MEKAPEDRYQSTGEMIADIEAFKSNPSITFGYYTEDTGDSDESYITDGFGSDVETESPEEVQNAYAAKTPAYAGAGAGSMGGGRSARRYADEAPADYLDDEYYDDDDYDDDDDEEERSSLVVPVLTGIVIVVLIVAVIFVATILSGYIKGGGKGA